MKSPFDSSNTSTPGPLKIEQISQWLQNEWIAGHDADQWQVLWTSETVVNRNVLARYEDETDLPEGYRYTGYTPFDQEIAPVILMESSNEEITYHSGGFLYRFEHTENGDTVEIPLIAVFTSDDFYDEDIISMIALPATFEPVWQGFVRECKRIDRALKPQQKVHIIGGWTTSFSPETEWDDIVLPPEVKDSIFDDVESFFSRGIHVYRRLNLKPFRKMLFAGVPGTGKTMLCSALAKWALEQDFLVTYISSADEEGPTFRKIQRALSIVARSNHPALIILEELDAYLHNEEKALVLNVLDGSEGQINEHGSLLIATTNYPEAIDERVLKRPGRLDRIFIVPEMNRKEDTEKMLRLYLGDLWEDGHTEVASRLVGYPGAFIREVAIYALTQVARDDLPDLSADLLEDSFKSLRDQINMRDDFLLRRNNVGYKGVGFGSPE
ncbi:MAG: ATP-binding protein [Chloroflexota bacterium]